MGSLMIYGISNEVLKKTTKCGHDYSCLTTGKCGNLLLCKIEKCFDKNMLYIKATKDSECVSCPYKFSYSSHGYICTCPTHYSIYEQNSKYNLAA
jgi:hypothetical protein